MARRQRIGSKDLGINPNSGREKDLFRWFIASYLFGKRIRQETARDTANVFFKSGLDSPAKLTKAGWQRLVNKLDEGRYTRYDESTARNLLEAARKLKDEYRGRISNVFSASKNVTELKKRLQEFKGVGPKTVEIFMRDIDDADSLIKGGTAKKKAA